ncbi:MAG: hypothetical protein F9K24_20810 [Leptonema illini]|uniref:Restriction endonuclease type IV Mrr domain-containing protein n=1 Tax=Leptonema illini TaxID=183 RepID=A0A833GXG0_9LEPT|nr:MAG: hypothetical protein F9K24_20810 [Leptonema illini]
MNDGTNLENEFARWADKEFGWSDYETRVLISGAVGERPHEVDIHGIIESEGYFKVMRAGQVIVASGVLGASGLVGLERAFASLIDGILPQIGTASMTVLLCGAALWWFGNSRRREHVWVECKDRKKRVAARDVMLFAKKIENVKDGKPRWQPNQCIMVSSSGFDVDAVDQARANDIDLYIPSGKGFRLLE